MKKVLVLLSAAALLLVSCAKVKDVYTGSPESREITFSPLAQPATKSGAINSTDGFPTTGSFYIAARLAGNPGRDYFEKTEYSYSSSYWRGTPARFWPFDAATLNFLAVTKQPNSAANAVTFGEGDPLANYASKVTVALANNQPVNGAQHDLMYSYKRASDKANVTMDFHHALAWVNFTVQSSVSDVLAVTGVTLNGAYYSGTATVTLSNYDSTSDALSATLGWSGLGDQGNIAVPGISSTTVTGSPAVLGDGLLIVPSSAAFTNFTVHYSLNGYNYSKVCSVDSVELSAGHKYTYNINISLAEITVTATVENWTGESPVAAS